MQKTISESFNRMLNARTLDKIDTDANYAHLVTSLDRPSVVGQALRLPGPAMATGAAALQCSRILACSSWVVLHRGKHFFHGCFESDPHRARDNGVTNVEFAQRGNLMDELDVFVVDAVTSVDLQMGF